MPRLLVVALLAVLAMASADATAGRQRTPAPTREPSAPASPGPAALTVPAGGDPAGWAAGRVQAFWRTAFPVAFGRPWQDVAHLVPVHRAGPTPPCAARPEAVAGQAYYCASADAIVWDADGLVPRLAAASGEAGVLVVLAHEMGHAVAARLGVTAARARDPAAYPTILLEAMADCDAGVALAGIGLTPEDRDRALAALVGFRDPLGVQPGDPYAHGNAFDRAGAFEDGYDAGPHGCAGMTLRNHAFTQRAFGSAADRADRGNLPLATFLDAVGRDAGPWFTTVGGRPSPPLTTAASGCATGGRQGPVTYCAPDHAIVVDPAGLAAVEDAIGDYAVGTLVAARYGLAALDARGLPVTGPAAGAAALCLAGAYTARLIDPTGPFALSPGDLDEAVAVLLAHDWADRDAAGAADPAVHGYDRVDRFRAGVDGGTAECFTVARRSAGGA